MALVCTVEKQSLKCSYNTKTGKIHAGWAGGAFATSL